MGTNVGLSLGFTSSGELGVCGRESADAARSDC